MQSQTAKLARMNKRTLAEMDKLGNESKVENQRIAAETSKAIVGHCDKLSTEVNAIDAEFQKQAKDCVVSDNNANEPKLLYTNCEKL